MVFVYLGQLGAQYPLSFHLIIMLISLLILVKSADLLIFGAINYSKKFGLSDYVIGFLIVGIVTSLPEFISAIFGNSIGEGGIVFGTFFGSCVLTITLMLGIELFAAKKFSVNSKLLGETKYYIPILVMLPLVLVWDGRLSRWDGFLMISTFIAYIVMIWKKEGTLGKIKKDVKIKRLWKDMFIFLGALAALLLSAQWLVFSAVGLSHILVVPPYVIAVIVIAWGTSIGDLTVDLKAIFAGHADVALGDIFSAFVVENVLFLGLVALIKPIVINPIILVPAATFFIVPLSGIIFFVKKELTWRHGLFLIGLYIAFIILQIFII